MPSIKPASTPPLLALCLAACSAASALDAGAPDGSAVQFSRTPGATCGGAADCDSSFCYGGRCCAQPCQFDPNHPECVACDAQGACGYPASQCSPAAGCTAGSDQYLGAALCQGGTCGQPAVQSCAPYVCSATGCQTECLDDTHCATGNSCSFQSTLADGGRVGSCGPKSAGGGFCDHADDCQSGLCLKNVCCAAICHIDPANPECTDCDPTTGACVYSDTVCRGGGCDQSNNFAPPTSCSQGSCPAATPTACQAYLCTEQGCNSECLTDKDCAGSAFCLYPLEGVPGQGSVGLQQGSCCPRFETGKPIYVDIAAGNDTVCCGYDRAHPCQTLIRVTTLWNGALQTNDRSAATLTLELAVDGGPGNWIEPAQYAGLGPEQLSNGMTVHAPGISFPNGLVVGTKVMAWGPHFQVNPNGQGGAIVVGLVAGAIAPASPATLKGDPGNPAYGQVSVAANSFPLPSPAVLNLANVVGGGVVGANGLVHLGAGADGEFGPTQGDWVVQGDNLSDTECNFNTLPSSSGNNAFQPECVNTGWMFDHVGQCVVATLDDLGPDRETSALAAGGVVAGDCAVVNLTHAPQLGFGAATDAGGAGPEPHALTATNRAQVHLANGAIAGTTLSGAWAAPSSFPCVTFHGIYPPPTYCWDAGVDPQIFLDNMEVTQNSCLGVHAQEGHVYLNQTAVDRNYIGLVQGFSFSGGSGLGSEVTGTVNLALLPDGGLAGGNQVFCNRQQFHGPSCPNYGWLQPGVDVWNQTPQPLLADGVGWSQFPPQEWSCDPNVDPGSCRGPGGQRYDGGVLSRVQTPDGFGRLAGEISAGAPSVVAGVSCQ